MARCRKLHAARSPLRKLDADAMAKPLVLKALRLDPCTDARRDGRIGSSGIALIALQQCDGPRATNWTCTATPHSMPAFSVAAAQKVLRAILLESSLERL